MPFALASWSHSQESKAVTQALSQVVSSEDTKAGRGDLERER